MPYEELTHTADISLRVWGASLEELYESAARGMFGIMGRPAKRTVARLVSLAAADRESLLVDWLSELLYLHETNGELYDHFEVSVKAGAPDWALDSRVFGGPGKVTGTKIKAVTYHGLQISFSDGVYKATLVFDA